MVRRRFLLLTLGLVANFTWAQTVPEVPAATPPPGNLFSRVSGIFGGDLPQLDLPDTVKVILRPHFGDLVRRDYLRVDTGLGWALNDHFELDGAASVFFTHGLGDSAGYGIGRLQVGSKYVFRLWPGPHYETSAALNYQMPVGHPPLDMTDGHYHLTPSLVLQHHSPANWRLTTFTGLGFDFLRDSNVRGTFGSNQPHDNSVSLTAGGVYDLGQLKWTLTTTYTTTALLSSRPVHIYFIQPGLLWYVPRKFTFNSNTQWIVALGAGTTWGPDGTDFSLTGRVRAEITFRQVMEKMHLAAPK